MDKNRILIVDDEKLISWSLAAVLTKDGYSVDTAASGGEALRKFASFTPDLVMLDINLPEISGLELLKRFKEADADVDVIIMTAYANADTAVQALQEGAEDFFGKPFNLDSVRYVVSRTFDKKRLRNDVELYGRQLRKRSDQDKLIGNSHKMIDVFKMIKVCADTDAKTVLITGESGTGKELVAKAIHNHSARAEAAFIELNCASIPENLLENELFGHEKGAFTDASKMHKGVFEMADGGTVFLDEIGDMPLAMQAKILKAVETKRFRRLGGQEEVEADVRIITATHRDLPAMVQSGKFRGDLFFRLNVINISLPPLRERKEDIPSLVQYFVEALNVEYGRDVAGAEPQTLALLTNYDWPGNVRELRNCIERLMMLEQEKMLSPRYLSDQIGRDGATGEAPGQGGAAPSIAGEHILIPASGISLDQLEKLLIQLALQKSGGNQTHAAKFLQTSRDTLRYRMKKFGLCDSAPGEAAEAGSPTLPAPGNFGMRAAPPPEGVVSTQGT